MKFSLDDSLGFIISKTSLRLKNNLQQSFKTYDITVEQWGLLNRLWETDGVSQKELAEKSCKDQANITRILDKLEEKGLIKRQADPKDRRAFAIFLTEAGWDLRDKLIPVAVEVLDKALRGIRQEEEEQLKVLLKRIYNNLD